MSSLQRTTSTCCESGRRAVGRSNASDADRHAAVAIVANSVWTREFDADPSVIGRTIRVADQFVEIVGVAPAPA